MESKYKGHTYKWVWREKQVGAHKIVGWACYGCGARDYVDLV